MALSDAHARGDGSLEYLLRLDGHPYLYATRSGFSTTIGGATFVAVKTGLSRESLEWSCRARPVEVWPETQGMTAIVRTRDADVLASLRSRVAGARTVLTTTLAAGHTTSAVVVSTSGFAGSGVVWIGGEPVSYTSTDADEFKALTRGLYGARDREHLVALDIPIPCEPEVSELPPPLEMTRASIYVAEYRDGVLGTPERRWVGYVSGPVVPEAGSISIPLSSVADGLRQGQVFGFIPSGRLRGIYIPEGPGDVGWDTLVINDSGTETEVSIAGGFYPTVDALYDAVVTALAGATGDWRLEWTSAGRLRLRYSGAGAGVRRMHGKLAWLLGWNDNEDGWTWLWTGTTLTEEAPDFPVDIFAVIGTTVGREGFEHRYYLHAGEAAHFVDSYCTLVVPQDSGTQYAPRAIRFVDTTNDYLVLETGDDPYLGEGEAWPEVFAGRGGAAPPIVKQAWQFTGRADDAIKMMIGATVASVGYTVPITWRPLPAIDPTISSDPGTGDVDFAQLTTLIASCSPVEAQICRLVITEAQDFGAIVAGLLLPCGIYGYQQRNGKLGFRMVRIPSKGEDAIAVSGKMLDARALPRTQTHLGAEPVVNVIAFEVPDGADHLESVAGSGLIAYDLRSIQDFGTRRPRDTSNVLGYLKSAARTFPCYAAVGADPFAWQSAVSRHLGSTLFALTRYPRAVTPLAVTPVARDVEIGDVVSVTAWPAYDPREGEIGLDAKLGIVLGWSETQRTGEVLDGLDVLLVDEEFGIIAFAALATGWNAGTKVLTIADATLYKRTGDVTDLDHLDVDDALRFYTYDSEAPGTWGPANVAVVTALAVNGLIELDADPFGGAFPGGGAVCVFADYADSDSSTIAEAWVWIADATTGLIAVGVDGFEWSP